MIHSTKKMWMLMLLLIGCVLGVQSQNAEDIKILEKQAKTLTEKYDQHLNLTEEQEAVFERTVKKFLLDSEEIHHQKISFADKTAALQNNSNRENKEMGNFLTKEQLIKYEALKADFQKVDHIEGYVFDDE